MIISDAKKDRDPSFYVKVLLGCDGKQRKLDYNLGLGQIQVVWVS